MTAGRIFIFRSWPADQTERLKELWWQGKTAAQCCRILGAASPRAVWEKVKREHFVRDPMLAKEKVTHALALPQRRDNGDPVTMETVRERECRWIYGEPSMLAPMCGRPTDPKTWCRGHMAICYGKEKSPC